jgi:hypothetical protein
VEAIDGSLMGESPAAWYYRRQFETGRLFPNITL